MPQIEIVSADADSDFESFALLDAEAFSGDLEVARSFARAMRGNLTVRLATVAGRPVGTYVLGPVQQRFGDRGVVAGPVSAVAVAPEARGLGVGAALMRDLVGVCREQQIALAPLWAATPRFYRRHGWGVGDRAYRHIVRIDALTGFRGAGEAVRNPAPEVWRALWAELIDGYDASFMPETWTDDLDFPAPPGDHRYAMGWFEERRCTGYMQFSQKRMPDGPVQTEVTRFGALTPDAHRGLLGVLAGSAGQSEEVTFANGRLPTRNFLHHVLDAPHRQLLRSEARFLWMQRIIDVTAALEQRGWDDRTAGRFGLRVIDSIAPDGPTSSEFSIEVEAGAVSVSPGGGGADVVSLDLPTLASWYCGGLLAVEAARLGAMSGSTRALRLMDRLVPRRQLWLSEFF